MADLPAFEALIRSPLGEIRVWIDDQGEQRTEMRVAFPSGADSAEQARLAAAVAEQAANVCRGVAGRTGAGTVSPNAFTGWFTERLTPDVGARVQVMTLYEDYLAWCALRGVARMSLRQFADGLSARGVLGVGKDSFGRKLRGGVRLAPAQSAPVVAPRAPELRSVGGAA